MDIIAKQAQRFADNVFDSGVGNYERILSDVRNKASDIDNKLDRIKFLNVVLEKNKSIYESHKLVCKKPTECQQNENHETISYYLVQELNRLDVHFEEDVFTEEEKATANDKLDKILEELAFLKNGQQLIYEDLINEINELRSLHFLGKKKWYQLLLGKSTDMVLSGIVSETVSKEIITTIKEAIPNLLS